MEISITSLENKNIADILIVTATPIETKAVHRAGIVEKTENSDIG